LLKLRGSNKLSDKNRQSTTAFKKTSKPDETKATIESKPSAKTKFVKVKLRVSALHNEKEDIQLSVQLSQTVLSLKQTLTEYIGVEPTNQRMFFGGKLLRDREKLRSHRLRKNVVIQVITKDVDEEKIKLHLENYLREKKSGEGATIVSAEIDNDADKATIVPVIESQPVDDSQNHANSGAITTIS
jgi:hypothetical protein